MIKENSFKAWLLAARLKTLSGAMIPVLIGSTLAYKDGKFSLVPTLLCLSFALLMQIAANFINDLFDYIKGADREDRLGPARACSQGWISPTAMKRGSIIVCVLACLTGSFLLFYGGWELILVGVLCVLFAFLYTAGPYPLSYHGWGDVLVLIFFGFIPVGFTYYVQAHSWSMGVTVASIICGCVIDTLLVVNNYRDRDTDAANGKKTIIVRYGETFGKYFYLLLGFLATFLTFYYATQGHILACLLPQIYLIFHVKTWKKMVAIHKGKALNNILGETSRNIIILGVLLITGLLIGI